MEKTHLLARLFLLVGVLAVTVACSSGGQEADTNSAKFKQRVANDPNRVDGEK